jgi:hypothetical protein
LGIRSQVRKRGKVDLNDFLKYTPLSSTLDPGILFAFLHLNSKKKFLERISGEGGGNFPSLPLASYTNDF